jgi:hypothetical protein
VQERKAIKLAKRGKKKFQTYTHTVVRHLHHYGVEIFPDREQKVANKKKNTINESENAFLIKFHCSRFAIIFTHIHTNRTTLNSDTLSDIKLNGTIRE